MRTRRRLILLGIAWGVLSMLAAACWSSSGGSGGAAPDADADADTDIDSDADTDADSDTDVDSDTDTDADSDTDTDSDTGSETESETESETGEPSPCETNANCSQEYCDQVPIPAGIYPRGSEEQPDDPAIGESCVEYGFGDETPRHDVYLDAFCIDKYEVTWKRYDACVGAGECPVPAGWADYLEDESIYTSHPMYVAGYGAAEAYCAWIGRRMCTEAEWERAANGPGPEKRTYPWGDDPSYLTSVSLFYGDESGTIAAVDAFPELASAEGVNGLAASALELIDDFYEPYEASDGGVLDNPIGPDDGDYRLARGGSSWIHSNYTNTERIIIDADSSQMNYAYW
jgi:formylglycine-generating enzyme required for sulfatase activity